MKLEFKKTPRGFVVAKFLDRYKHPCSIQESSLATEAAVWLGIDTDTKSPDGERSFEEIFEHAMRCDGLKQADKETFRKGFEACGRMHLTVDMAKQIISSLTVFVETGFLPSGRDGGDGF